MSSAIGERKGVMVGAAPTRLPVGEPPPGAALVDHPRVQRLHAGSAREHVAHHVAKPSAAEGGDVGGQRAT